MLPKIIARHQRRVKLEKQLEEKNKIKVVRKKTIEEVQKLMEPKPKDFVLQIGSGSRLGRGNRNLDEAADLRQLSKLIADRKGSDRMARIGSQNAL